MTNGEDTSGSHGDDEDAERREPPAEEVILVARIESCDGEPDTCTIYPPDADDVTILSTWMSADVDGFVALDEVR